MIRLTTKRPSIVGYLSAIVLAQVCWIAPLAFGNDAKEEFQKAVSAQINETVNRDVEAYFRQLQLQEPVKVETSTEAEIDTSGSIPRVTLIRLNVSVVTDQPPQVVRQARHRLVRLLREQGYRFDTSEGLPGDSRPLAVLNIKTTPPPPTQAESEQTWVYAGFAVLIIALFTSLLTLLYILFLPWIRWHRAKKRQALQPKVELVQEPNVQDLPLFPTPPAHIASSHAELNPKSSGGLPPLPPILNMADPAVIPRAQSQASSIEVGSWSTLSQTDS